MAKGGLLAPIVRDQRGAALIEFAILGPLVIGLLFGVFQIGIGMQAQNSLRSIAADTARYAAVEFQKDQTPSNARIQTEAMTIATSNPYNLDNSVRITVVNAATQRVSGAREMTLTISYTVPAVLPLLEWASPTLTHTRPIFVLN